MTTATPADLPTSPDRAGAGARAREGAEPAKPRRRRKGQRPTAAERKQLQDDFLAIFALRGNFSQACRTVKVDRNTVRAWLKADPAFRVRYDDAEEESTDGLEQIALDRGTIGAKRLVMYHGEPAYDPRTGEPLYDYIPSDRLLEMLLKARRPDKYRDNGRLELTGAGGGPIQVEDARELLKARLELIAGRRHRAALRTPGAPAALPAPGDDQRQAG